MPSPLGLIAGIGGFPIAVVHAAHARGERVVAVAFEGQTDARLAGVADELRWSSLGKAGEVIEFLRGAGVSRAIMAGKISKQHLVRDVTSMELDEVMRRLIAGLPDQRDDSIQGAIADTLEAEGIHLLTQPEVAPDLFIGEGLVGEHAPTEAQWRDIAFGWPIAKAVAGLDIGQTLVVRDRSVLAVEAIEGTDPAIARGAALAGGGAVVLKVAKPQQDLRFDMPGLGLDTLARLVEGKAAVLAFEADQTVVLDRDALVRQADAHGIALLGIPAEGPAEGRA